MSCPFAGMTRIRFEGFGRQAISAPVKEHPSDGREHRGRAGLGKRYRAGLVCASMRAAVRLSVPAEFALEVPVLERTQTTEISPRSRR